ncbi:flagellar assembly protein FliH [Sporosarcina limicola]|uniref:flagellar assembly protein FliH n=1 Tax=Sporosarcina limicola TaxID=34101 RepID=UPI00178AE47A
MTLLSNIFRSHDTIFEERKTRKISIRSLSVSQDMKHPEKLSLDVLLAERDRLYKEANGTIEQEKVNIEQLRQTAMDDISSMQATWENEKMVLQQQAYDEGFQVGYEEGRNKALSDMEISIQQANDATEQSHINADKYLVSQERVILELAMLTAKRIIGHSLKEDEEVYLSIVRRALKEAREMKEIRLYVSSTYFKLVSDNRAELTSIFPPDVPFLIFANDDFESTQCYIETNHGRIVVSIDDQLNELRERLVEIMESGD